MAFSGPTLGLPLEVLCRIFLHCQPDEARNVSFNGSLWRMHPNVAPLLLLRVCRAWRAVTESTPELWSNLHLPILRLPFDNMLILERRAIVHGSFISALTTWLSLSKFTPLSFDFATDNSPFLAPTICPSLDALTSHSCRWKHVKIQIHSFCAERVGRTILHYPFKPLDLPLLESFTYQQHAHTDLRAFAASGDSSDDLTVLLFGLANCERLRKVCIRLPPRGHWNWARLMLPWERLTHLELGQPYVHSQTEALDLPVFMHNLSQCQSLVSLVLDMPPQSRTVSTLAGSPVASDDPLVSQSTFTLPRLRHLSILQITEAAVLTAQTLLSSLVTPHLRELHCTFHPDVSEAYDRALDGLMVQFVDHFSGELRVLEVTHGLGDSALMKILGISKGLESLVLGSRENLYLYPQTLGSLILCFDSNGAVGENGGTGRLVGGSCPQLRRLTINAEMASSLPMGLGVIMTIVESRWRMPEHIYAAVGDDEVNVHDTVAGTSEQVRRLEEVDLMSVDTERQLTWDQLESLKMYVQEGLKLKWSALN